MGSISPLDNISKTVHNKLNRLAKEEAEESMGGVMIFTIASVLKDWLDEHVGGLGEDADDDKVASNKTVEDTLNDNRIPTDGGTQVTKETFKQWNDKFMEEYRKEQYEKNKERMNRLTGKQIFEKNLKAGLNFVEDEDESEDEDDGEFDENDAKGVKFDEELFDADEDLDGL